MLWASTWAARSAASLAFSASAARLAARLAFRPAGFAAAKTLAGPPSAVTFAFSSALSLASHSSSLMCCKRRRTRSLATSSSVLDCFSAQIRA